MANAPQDSTPEPHRRTVSRKKDHVDLVVNDDVGFRQKSAGFERIELEHNALPEIDLADIDTSTSFLGKAAALPLMISSMTGGYREAENINRQLAEVCQEIEIPMGVGSQRQALENPRFHESFRTVRRTAPTIAISANIGATEVARPELVARIHIILDMVEADALTVHLNPLQELLQPEGNTSFRGVLAGIEELARRLPVPIIAKEVGAGISAAVARRLLAAGVSIIDVAGAGGTSWAGVEILRRANRQLVEQFWEWGIPTVDCLRALQDLRREQSCGLVASGGVQNGLDVAKTIALGADMAAAARPFIKALVAGGRDTLLQLIRDWQYQLRCAMFLTGSATLGDLAQTSYSYRVD